MSTQQESPAVAIARAHVEAWSKHDFDSARSLLADDVKVTATSSNPALPQTDLTGAGNYMEGLDRLRPAHRAWQRAHPRQHRRRPQRASHTHYDHGRRPIRDRSHRPLRAALRRR